MNTIDRSRNSDTDNSTREADERERAARSADAAPKALSLLNQIAGTERYGGASMRDGLRAFQTSEGLPITGEPDDHTLAALERRASQLPEDRQLERLDRDGDVQTGAEAPGPHGSSLLGTTSSRPSTYAKRAADTLHELAAMGRELERELAVAAVPLYPTNKVAALKKGDSYEISASVEVGVGRGAAEEQLGIKVTRDENGLFKIEASSELGAAALKKGDVNAKIQAAAGAKVTFQARTPEEAKKLTECLLQYGGAAYNPLLEGVQQLRGHGVTNAKDTAFLREHMTDLTISGAASAQVDRAFGNEAERRAVGAAFQGVPAEKVTSTIHFQGGRPTTVEVAVETSGKLALNAGAGVARIGSREKPSGMPLAGVAAAHQEEVSVTLSNVYALPEHVDLNAMMSAPVPLLTQLEGKLAHAGARSVTVKSERANGVQLGPGGSRWSAAAAGSGGEQSVTTRTLVAKGWSGGARDLLNAAILVTKGDMPDAARVFGSAAQVQTDTYRSTEKASALSIDAEIKGVGVKLKGQTKERHRESGPTHAQLELPPRPIYV